MVDARARRYSVDPEGSIEVVLGSVDVTGGSAVLVGKRETEPDPETVADRVDVAGQGPNPVGLVGA
jgi:hypothetical protein